MYLRRWLIWTAASNQVKTYSDIVVGGIVLVDGKALLATNTMTGYFYILSGAVNLGEASEDAAVRVMNEKTGGNYSVSRLLTIVENFFDYEFNDTKYDFQEVIFYYLMEPREIKCPDRKNKLGGGRTETLHWIPLPEAAGKDIRPRSGKEMILNLPLQVQTIISDERSDYSD